MESFVVRKLASGIVSYRIPGKLIARKWKGDNARVKVPYEELEDCVFDPNIRTLFEKGYLYIEDKEARVRLQLEEPDPSIQSETKLVLTKEQINDLLYKDTFYNFKKKVEKLADETKELLIEVAIQGAKHAGVEKYDYIRKNFYVDVEKIQRERREEKEG